MKILLVCNYYCFVSKFGTIFEIFHPELFQNVIVNCGDFKTNVF